MMLQYHFGGFFPLLPPLPRSLEKNTHAKKKPHVRTYIYTATVRWILVLNASGATTSFINTIIIVHSQHLLFPAAALPSTLTCTLSRTHLYTHTCTRTHTPAGVIGGGSGGGDENKGAPSLPHTLSSKRRLQP